MTSDSRRILKVCGYKVSTSYRGFKRTQPGGSVQHIIEYHAPFDCCDREQDYETAREFFSNQH